MSVEPLKTPSGFACTDAEWNQRVNLAAALQLAEHFGWTMLIWNHISARVPGSQNEFLMNSHGLMYDETTASNISKVDIGGNELTPESNVAPAGFIIHGAVYEARPDVGCVVHSHTPEGVAVSCLKDGLPQLGGEFGFFYDDLVFYDYEGVSLDLDERAHIAACLGNKNAMIMRNHGLTTCGRTVPEAFMRMYWLIYCCRVMTQVHSMGRPFNVLPDELAASVAKANEEVAAPGDHEWPALLRRLDRIAPHYKT